VSGQRDLPIGDRDEAGEMPRPGEALAFVERVGARDYGAPTDPAASCCRRRCRDRGWACQSEPSGEERINRIFDGVGAEG
jgi:hypothetical protein